VPRDGIEPPTRGFSKQQEKAGFAGGNAVFSCGVSGSCAVSSTAPDPDEALKTAIKVAVDAGQYDRAAKLLDVLRSTPAVAAVIDLAKRREGER
jgi:hypothetical protein